MECFMRRDTFPSILITLFIIFSLLPVAASMSENGATTLNFTPPLPGHYVSDAPLFAENPTKVLNVNKKIIPINQSYNEDIIPIIQNLQTEMTIGYIENLTSFGPRLTGSNACSDAGRYIYNEFLDMGLEVRYHNWSVSNDFYGSNIEATLQGINNPNEEIYIICGHYDSVSSSPGADDNAAGTSVVLAAAELLSDFNFNHTIRFVAFSGEEQGLYGSHFYASDAYENGDNIIAVLNADMMGYAETEEGRQRVVVYDNDDSSWITNYTNQISIDYYDYINLEIFHGGSSGRSDHASFHREGFNAIFYFEYEVNPYYHTHNDILEHMDPHYATNVSRLALATLISLGELTPGHAPEKPMRPSGRESGNTNEEYTYSTTSYDPDNDDLWYRWDWGDGSYSDWIGPYSSGETCEINHSWKKRGDYEIRVQSKDEYDLKSSWSDPYIVTMPKNNLIDSIFQRYQENHPQFYSLLLNLQVKNSISRFLDVYL